MDDYSILAKNYHFALGRFIDAFAKVESMLLDALRRELGLEPKVAKAVFLTQRIAEIKTVLLRLREAKGIREHTSLTDAFAQLSILTNVRNDLVHYGAEFEATGDASEVKPFVSNASTKMDGGRRSEVTPENLLKANADLLEIQNVIYAVLISQDLMRIEAVQLRRAHIGWLYKP